jgi:hypothetical protein
MPSIARMTGGPLGKAVTQRLSGEKPAAFTAFAGATMAGMATAVIVYRVLRSTPGDDDE